MLKTLEPQPPKMKMKMKMKMKAPRLTKPKTTTKGKTVGRAMALGVFVAAGLCSAANPKAASLARAAEQQYRLGKVVEAAESLRQAYDLEPISLFLFNRARALEVAGETAAAMGLYERYALLPTEETDPELVARARATLEQRARRTIGQAPPKKAASKLGGSLGPVTELEARAAPSPKLPALVVAGLSVASLGVGVAFGLSASSAQMSFAAATTLQSKQRFEAETRQRALVADLCFGLGAAAAIATVLLFLKSDEGLTVALVPIAQGGLASVGLWF